MKLKFALAVLLIAPLALTACAKPDAPASHEASSSEAATEVTTISAEQQAAIDALDQPVQDEKNTDVPASVAQAPADAITTE
ncbi:hypothetical protein [Acinetobacter shaoyimingii]|uniref:Lipoprotein n=1 Tax=Acinetobacter shaoyimingii TaxID=2715164 RepID=A0A6G8RUV9_9GAMM|nr:hypothetical protein [Acinetobacter shaoyimingii]QIO05722.1 hypothetical protein G8E00_07030 [Acinetobacter shaoyimingii]